MQLESDGSPEDEMLDTIKQYNAIFLFYTSMVISWYAIHILSSRRGGLEFTQRVTVYIFLYVVVQIIIKQIEWQQIESERVKAVQNLIRPILYYTKDTFCILAYWTFAFAYWKSSHY